MSDAHEEPSFLDQVRFSQGLTLWRAMARGVGVMLVAAVLVLMNDAAAAGTLAPLAFFLAALLAIINGLGYAELAVGSPRTGGAYTIVYRGTGDEGQAFLTGWMLALSGIGLCGLLAQSAASYLAQLLTASFGRAVPRNALAAGLVILVVLVKRLQRRARRRLSFTPLALAMLTLVVALAVPRIRAANFRLGHPQVAPAIPALLAAFVALELITGYQREIRRRAINLPRAMLIAPLLVAGIGAVMVTVVAGAIGSRAATAAEAPLAALGEAVAGAWGQAAVLLVGAAFLLLSLSQALPVVVRQLFVMSRDGFWPEWLRKTHRQRGTLTRLVTLVGLLVIPVVWVPADLLPRISGLLYLLTLMSVNVALVRRRPAASPAEIAQNRQAGESEGSSFTLPFHPWIPALTLAVDALAIPLWGLMPAVWAVACLGVGGLVYLAYGRGRYIEAQEGVTIFRSEEETRRSVPFRVLVPIANPATAGALLRLGGKLAALRGGEVLALQVVVVPEPVPLETGRRRAKAGQALFKQALTVANQENLPVKTMTRVARSVGQGILDTADDERVHLILTGWRGPAHARETSLGPVLDSVLRDAPCDVLIARGQDTPLPKRILVPTSGGPHARAAARLALSLAEACQAEVTLLSVLAGPHTEQQTEQARRRLAETLSGLDPPHPPLQRVTTAPAVVDGIVQEAQEYDLVLLGVSEESLLDRLVFGSVPLQVAVRVPHTVLVQGARGITGVWRRRIARAVRENLPTLNAEEQLAVRQELTKGARPGINYFVLTVLSCVIATFGLLQDSPTVVIGAMLVAPLWSPILAFSLGLVQGELRLIRFSVEAMFKGVALAIIIATFIGLLSPLKDITGEILIRAQPTLLDLAVALAAGFAGAYAVARKDLSAALPGVAIAATLMPALATVGLGLSMGNARVAGGALLLFATNTAAIGLAVGVVFLLLGIRPPVWGPESRKRLWRRLAASLLLVLVIAIPLGVIMASTLRSAAEERAVEVTISEHLTGEVGQLVSLEIGREPAHLLVVATVRSSEGVPPEVVNDLASGLSSRLGRPVQLEVVVLPVIRSDGR